jgi:hypothetical protein
MDGGQVTGDTNVFCKSIREHFGDIGVKLEKNITMDRKK